jgi:hypothetical protein
MSYEQEEQINLYKKKLQTGNCVVQFTKKDGTIRDMVCTTNSDIISEQGGYRQSSGRSKLPSIESQAVFDLQLNEWRSFRWDSVVFVRS